MQLIIFTGLQASGKSSFYRDNYFNSHVRISMEMLNSSKSKEQKLIEGCIAAKLPCVIDNTNLTVAHRARYIKLFRSAGYEIHSYFFDSLIEDCLSRNSIRKDKEPIPVVAIRTANKKITIPTLEEGIQKVFLVNVLDKSYSFRVREQSLA